MVTPDGRTARASIELAIPILVALLGWQALPGEAAAAEPTPGLRRDALDREFAEPPAAARPWVYWFWLNGNITREGITADLEAMRRVGIGGVLIMEVDQGIPLGPVAFLSDAWRELFRHAVAEAARLGLEVNMNNDAGWNGSGGPWIRPDQAMQKIVWTEEEVSGPARVERVLPQPETVAGHYRDIAVLAFPTPAEYAIENIRWKAGHPADPPVRAGRKELTPEAAIDRGKIRDLSASMDAGGRLVWDAPPGRWTVLRLGHTCTGVENAPAPASGRGLECDKLSPQGVEANFDGMMAKLIADVGPAASKTLVATHVDSWENGSQNWTARMREEFRARRGYDLQPFLPVVTARVVESLEVSERFLWDLRRTISELVVESYAGHLRKLAHRHGLRFTIEAYGSPCDHLPYAGSCDEPMGEFWMGGGAMNTCRGMASAGHVYGNTIIGAEAFTAGDRERWLDHPGSIKALGDEAFCEGINRFVFHRYALQPWLDRRPGMTMGPWGLHYERTQTWWEETPDWHLYLARCQHLLRQGLYVADICHVEPEDSPAGFRDHPRNGYGWDQCDPDAVISRMSARDGLLVLPDGMTYRVLALPGTSTMTPRLLRKVKELVLGGATVVGSRPVRSPSLQGYPECDAEVAAIAGELWGEPGGDPARERKVGLGRVVEGASPERVLFASGIGPDFSSDARLRYIHRRAGGTDLYFVANPAAHAVDATATFRVSGRAAELWRPESGRIERAAMSHEKDGATTVLLELEPAGSVFVVFRPGTSRGDPAVSIARDSRTLFSVEEPSPRVRVEKATYGVLGDPARTRDVREKVQRKMDGREHVFAVTDMAAGDDPAFRVVKELEVEYTIGEERYTVRARDGGLVHISPDAVRISVEKALYGILDDPKRTRDVRELVQRIADSGESSFQVARLAALEDPAVNVVKTVVLEYTIGGRRVAATGTDPETIFLGLARASRSMAQLRMDSEGRVVLEARQPGRYDVTLVSGRRLGGSAEAIPEPVDVGGPWEASFHEAAGGERRSALPMLTSWTESADEEVRHFSGTATYRTSFAIPDGLRRDDLRLFLDLGRVGAMARVVLNGKDLGVLYRAPFRVDATEALVAGSNRLEVRVTNLWPNRLIGDERMPEAAKRNPDGTLVEWPAWIREGKPDPSGRRSFTTWRLWGKDEPLLESGLLGPVRLVASRRVALAPSP